jgi:hypothetical protein
VLPITAAGAVGFVIGIVLNQDRATQDPLLTSLLMGVRGAFITAAIATYIAAIVISGLKGKPFFVVMGLLALAHPAISLLPFIGAIRIAKPNSRWAQKYYGPEKMQIAIARFPKAASLPRR